MAERIPPSSVQPTHLACGGYGFGRPAPSTPYTRLRDKSLLPPRAPQPPPSWPGLSRPSTSFPGAPVFAWMPGTSPGMTKAGAEAEADSAE